MTYSTPFTKDYVIRTTLNHMNESINISIKKTINRLREFEDDPKKRAEVGETLDCLTALANLLVDIKTQNRDLIEAYKDN